MIRRAAPGVVAAARRRTAAPVSTFFGSTSGHSGTSDLGAGYKQAQAFTCPGNGTAQKGRAWFAGNGPAQMMLYANSAGTPGALICQSNSVTYPGSPGYVDFPFTTTPALTSGTSYWICLYAPGGSAATYGHVLSPTQTRYYNTDGLTNPFGTLSGGDSVVTMDVGAYVLI